MEDDILMLNDYCFLAIFKHISTQDLINFKNTYKSVGAAADRDFSRKMVGVVHFEDGIKVGFVLQNIKHFGSINHLKFSYCLFTREEWKEIFLALQQHCNENLKSLSIRGEAIESIKNDYLLLIACILKNIETLNFFNATRSHVFPSILSHCENVKNVKFSFVIDKKLHKTIFQKNQNLLKLKITSFIEDTDLKMIVDNLMNTRLEELSLHIERTTTFDGNISLLNQLFYLKRLSITCLGADVSSFLRNGFRSLNVLSLHYVYLSEQSISMLGVMNQLKVLSLNVCSLANHSNSYIESLLVLCGNKNIERLLYLLPSEHLAWIDEANFLKLIAKRRKATVDECLHLSLIPDIYFRTVKEIPSVLLESNEGTINLIDPTDRNYKFCDLLQ